MKHGRVEKEMTTEEFIEKYSNIELILYVNEHTLEKSISRIGKVDFNVQSMKILFQKYRKEIEINDFKGLLDLGFGKAIINIYEKNGKFYGKVLTILTESQLILSKNFWFYSRVEKEIPIKIKKVIKENRFFDYDYNNIFDKLDLDIVKNDIISNGEEVSKEEFELSERKTDLNLNKYYKIKLNDYYLYTD